MSETVEILHRHDVEDIVIDYVNDHSVRAQDIDTFIEDWFDTNAEDWIAGHVYIHDEFEIRELASQEVLVLVEGEVEILRREINDLIDGQNESLLEQRVARLEAVNAKLLETLGQFTQLLSHRDLI